MGIFYTKMLIVLCQNATDLTPNTKCFTPKGYRLDTRMWMFSYQNADSRCKRKTEVFYICKENVKYIPKINLLVVAICASPHMLCLLVYYVHAYMYVSVKHQELGCRRERSALQMKLLLLCCCSCSVPQLNTMGVTQYVHPHLYTCLYVCVSVMCVYLSVCMSVVCVCLSVCSVCLPVCSVCVCVCLSVCLSTCL